MRRVRNPLDTLAGALWGVLMVAMAIGGFGAMGFTCGWLVLKSYDWLVACLG